VLYCTGGCAATAGSRRNSQILTGDADVVAALLTGERATELRQSSPFAGVLFSGGTLADLASSP
jgi:hypothetical protein